SGCSRRDRLKSSPDFAACSARVAESQVKRWQRTAVFAVLSAAIRGCAECLAEIRDPTSDPPHPSPATILHRVASGLIRLDQASDPACRPLPRAADVMRDSGARLASRRTQPTT